ncbi:MAG TPA: porin family protein [Puia sp.]|uniref:porin family protein n=1 Tax=Puia sp. TaxID=2045100 RepID=UPI002B574656|nr:porin family protein [Puia sp.]HVU99355.1 porin family protein [Puia sp.]
MRNFHPFLVVACLSHALVTHAQTTQSTHTPCTPWLGLKGGISIPNLTGGGGNPLSDNYSSRLAANFGIFAEHRLHGHWSLQAELNYAGQGGKRDGLQPISDLPPELAQMVPPGSFLYAKFKNKAILDYLELPILAKLTWGTPWQFYVNAGPYAGYLLHAKEKTSGASLIYADPQGQQPLGTQYGPVPPQDFAATTDVTSSIKRWNVGVTGGIGVAKPLGTRNKIFFDTRFEYGFINIQKYKEDGKNNTGNVLLSLGYAYRL